MKLPPLLVELRIFLDQCHLCLFLPNYDYHLHVTYIEHTFFSVESMKRLRDPLELCYPLFCNNFMSFCWTVDCIVSAGLFLQEEIRFYESEISRACSIFEDFHRLDRLIFSIMFILVFLSDNNSASFD